jgi:hypothetical protein
MGNSKNSLNFCSPGIGKGIKLTFGPKLIPSPWVVGLEVKSADFRIGVFGFPVSEREIVFLDKVCLGLSSFQARAPRSFWALGVFLASRHRHSV